MAATLDRPYPLSQHQTPRRYHACSGNSHPDPRTQLVALSGQWLRPRHCLAAGDFDDSNWRNGPAPLGYGNGDEATVVDYGPYALSKYVTTYFRHPFYISNAGGFTALDHAHDA